MEIKADSYSAASVKTLCDHHLVFVSSDLTDVPNPNTPCNSCHHPNKNWFCLSCKEVLCAKNGKKCLRKHYQQTKHYLVVNCSDKSIWCRSCNKKINPQVIQQLKANSLLNSKAAMEIKANSDSATSVKTLCDHHLVFVSSDLTHLTDVPNPDTPCNTCHHPDKNWFCLSCKEVFCAKNGKKCLHKHYRQTKHYLAVNCSDKSIWCRSCNKKIDPLVIQKLKANVISSSDSGRSSSMKIWCTHMATLLPSDISGIPSPDTPCLRCTNWKGSWFCLYCKDVLCKDHMLEHYDQTDHSLAIVLSRCRKSYAFVRCYSCNLTGSAIAHQVIRQSQASCSSSKDLEKLDAMMIDVTDRTFHICDYHPPDAMSWTPQVEVALAKNGLQMIFHRGLEALDDDDVQNEFLTYSSTFLSLASCPLDLEANLSSFSDHLREEISTFLQARHELKVSLNLLASINQKKIMILQQARKYDEARDDFLASEEKIANLKAMINELEAFLAAEERHKMEIGEVLDSLDTQVTLAANRLVSDFTQMSVRERSTKVAKELVIRLQTMWDSLRTSFMEFAYGDEFADGDSVDTDSQEFFDPLEIFDTPKKKPINTR